jgi:hypothetical protein
MIDQQLPGPATPGLNGAAPAATGLRTCALAGLAACMHETLAAAPEIAEHRALLAQLHAAGGLAGWRARLAAALHAPAPGDETMVALGEWLGLTPGELLAVVLAAAVEEDPLVGRVLAYLQQPAGDARPTLGLLAAAFAPLLGGRLPPLYTLLTGAAIRSGLLALTDETAPMPECSLFLPQPLCLALQGAGARFPGALPVDGAEQLPLAPAIVEEARRRAHAMADGSSALLTLRSGAPEEGRAVACIIAATQARRPLFLPPDLSTAGLGVYLHLCQMLPVFCCALAPGEEKVLPPIPFYTGPVLAVCGPDGTPKWDGRAAMQWTIPVPNREERALLWQQALGDTPLAVELACFHRHSSARIAELGRLARYEARQRGHATPDAVDLHAAAWAAGSAGLETLAQPLPDPIPDEALVTTPALRRDLEALLLRCRARDGLVDTLGASARARYHPGVRVLLVGASGTGKTLAAGWLAAKLQMPLYRVDLASVTSKYIGETEKNLAQLLARAEQSEIILLFDEADSLFGKRTDVQQANDRYANAQTNYLLQRIESYDGIAILTSNSRSRFDQAFTRRLDAIVDFPTPGPQERRALWLAHLGANHQLDGHAINRLAAVADLAGGHIRNVALTAAVLAQHAGRPINDDDLLAGLAAEYRKLGRQLPTDL